MLWVVLCCSALISGVVTQGPPSGGSSSGGTQQSGGQSSGGSGSSTLGVRAKPANNPEVQAITSILASYPGSTLTRPLPPWEITTVTLSLLINSFDGIDDLQETMSFSGLIVVKWKDNYLRWNPQQYPNVKSVHLRYFDVWLPLIIQSSAPGTLVPILNANTDYYSERLTVTYRGNVTAVAAGTFDTQCNLDLSLFPFDSQTCSYTFQAWGYAYDLMQVISEDPSYVTADSSSIYSPQWVITAVSNETVIAFFQDNPYSCLTYSITATRRATFYTMNVLLPCMLMALLALATFLFPFDPGRVVYAVTVILGFAVYQTLITAELPQTATNISLVVYIISEMFIASFISLHSTVIIWLATKYAQSGEPLAPMLARIPYVQVSHPITHKIPKSKYGKEIPAVHASAKIINMLEKERVENKYADDWIYFLNLVDTVVMIICVIVTFVMPLLIFYSSLFRTDESSITSPVPTNYVENYYAITTQAKPSGFSTTTPNIPN